MLKDSEVIAALIAGITVFMAEGLKLLYSYLKEKRETKGELSYFIDNDYEINKKIWVLLNDIHADRVYIGRFHNGGSYYEGMSVKKFTITNEAFSENVGQLIMPVFKERLLSEFTNLFKPLVYTGKVEIKSNESEPDRIVQKYLDIIGGKVCLLYCIRGVNNKPMGYLGIHYNDEIEISDEKKETILNFAQTLVPFLTK